MLDFDVFSATVLKIYDTSLSVERWDDVLATLGTLFESPQAQISYYESLEDPTPFFRFWGVVRSEFDPVISRYRDLALSDPRAPPRLFKAYHCRQIMSDQALRSTTLYQQVLAPAGIEYAMYFGLDLDRDGKCAVGIMRGPEQAPFTDANCDDFGRFIPHISRAVTMHGALRRARGELEAARRLIDSVPLGMIVVQGDTIVLTNAAGRALLDREDPLGRLGARLRGTTSEADSKLRKALQQARSGLGGPVGLALATGEWGLVRALVRRLHSPTARAFGAPDDAIAIYLADSRQPVETSQEVLRRLFGLTEREASVLRAVIDGDDTRGISERLGIGVETVKTHLRHIMQGTAVNSRTELVKLVLSSPAWLRDRGGGGDRSGL